MSSYLPPQHGAWAFLGLPLALGLVVAPWTPVLLVLAVAWIAVYPMSYAALGMVRSKRPERFRRPFAVWLAVVIPSCLILLWQRPWLVWAGGFYFLLFLVNVWYARKNDERAIQNDLVFITECSAMVWIMWAVGAGDRSWAPAILGSAPAHVWILVMLCGLTLLGSTLHVKSLIREKRDPRFSKTSRVVADGSIAIALCLAAWWGLPNGFWLIVPFVAMAARARIVGRRPMRPGAIGIVELWMFILVWICALLASI
ncbi:MAG: YwiC-like family protein [Actinomycetota bacterium]|nr:YwiC-like family protein [Actinomycetota bacterium]